MDSLPRVLSGIIPDRELTIVAVECGRFAVRVRYRVDPPFPDDRGIGGGDLSWRFVHWQTDLKDDMDTQYVQADGAPDWIAEYAP